METIYDWVTVALFAGLIVLFLQRSSAEGEPQDTIWQYLIAAVGCAVTNYLGNEAVKVPEEGADPANPMFHLFAVATLVATVAYIWIVLKPFKKAG